MCELSREESPVRGGGELVEGLQFDGERRLIGGAPGFVGVEKGSEDETHVERKVGGFVVGRW